MSARAACRCFGKSVERTTKLVRSPPLRFSALLIGFICDLKKPVIFVCGLPQPTVRMPPGTVAPPPPPLLTIIGVPALAMALSFGAAATSASGLVVTLRIFLIDAFAVSANDALRFWPPLTSGGGSIDATLVGAGPETAEAGCCSCCCAGCCCGCAAAVTVKWLLHGQMCGRTVVHLPASNGCTPIVAAFLPGAVLRRAGNCSCCK